MFFGRNLRLDLNILAVIVLPDSVMFVMLFVMFVRLFGGRLTSFRLQGLQDFRIRSHDHNHISPFLLGRKLHYGDVFQFQRDSFQHLLSEFRVGHFTATKHHECLDFAAGFDELTDMARLEIEIMFVNLRAITHLLHLEGMLFFLGQLIFFGQLVFQFAIIKDTADGRSTGRRNFDQVKTLLTRSCKCFIRWNNPQLVSFGAD